MAHTTYSHLEAPAEGVQFLTGTKTKVVEIVLDRLAHHWDADEIQRQHPHLTLAQIYSALAYYHDHQDDIDRDIEMRFLRGERIRADLGESRLRLKVRSADKHP